MLANDISFSKHKGEVFVVDNPSRTKRNDGDGDTTGWVHGDRITPVEVAYKYEYKFQLLNLDTMSASLYGSPNSKLEVVPLTTLSEGEDIDDFWSDKPELYNVLTLDQRVEFEKAFTSMSNSNYSGGKNPSRILRGSFRWLDSPQGHDYWSSIYYKLEDEGL